MAKKLLNIAEIAKQLFSFHFIGLIKAELCL